MTRKPAGPRASALQARRAPVQGRSRVTVDSIIEATARLLSAEGDAGATTERIAAKAGVSVGSLYQYFPSKSALLGAVVDRHLAEMAELLVTALEGASELPLEEAVLALVQAAIAAHGRDPSLHRALLEESPALLGRGQARELEARLVSLVERWLTARPDIRLSAPCLAAFLVVRTVDSAAHGAVLDHPELLRDPALASETAALITRYLTRES